MRAVTERSALRSKEREWRAAPNHILVAAHPLVAGFLATLGSNFANAAELEIENLTDWRVELAAGVLFAIGCMVFSFVAPYLPAFGQWVAP